ncbi:MAG: hypothetical protein ABJB74_14155 [Gemmatimonas sp.]
MIDAEKHQHVLPPFTMAHSFGLAQSGQSNGSIMTLFITNKLSGSTNAQWANQAVDESLIAAAAFKSRAEM